MTPASATQAQVLPPVAVEVLESLYQHRLLTGSQINQLHTPGRTLRWTRRLLTPLHEHELIARAGGPHNYALWYLTDHGADTIEAISKRAERRRRLSSPEQAAGPLRAHTLAVNDVGIAFARTASLNDDPEFCAVLAGVVLDVVEPAHA